MAKSNYTRILVVRTDRIGDVILTLPVVTNLRLANKDAFIAFLGSEYSRKVLKDNPYLNEYIVYEPKGRHAGISGLFRLVSDMKRNGFDTVLHVYPRLKPALAAFLAGITLRIGPASKWYSFLFNKNIPIHRSRVEKHELQYNLELLKPLNVPVKDTNIKIWFGEKQKRFATDFFKANKLSGKVIAIHPGGAAGSMYNWSPLRYVRLIDTLQEKLKLKVLLIGGKGEEKLTRDILSKVETRPPVLKGRADIRQLASILEKVAVLISKNTGTMHTAASVKTPTISFFSPVFAVSEKRWGPWGNKAIIMKPKLNGCRKCTGDGCVYYDCMDTIRLDDVVKNIRSVVNER